MSAAKRARHGSTALDPLVYQTLHTGTLGDIAFYCDLVTRLIIKRGHKTPDASPPRVLELGCGAGRIAIPLAEAGAQVVGIDHHPGLLDLARIKLERRCAECSELEAFELTARLEFVHLDFESLSRDRLPQSSRDFDLILLPYNGLYCLLTEAQQRSLIETSCQLLAPHGALWTDGYALPDPSEYLYDSEADYSPLTVIEFPEAHAQDVTASSPRTLGVEERDHFTQSEQRLDIHYRYRAAPEDQDQEPLHGAVEVIQHRYIYPWQLQGLCDQAQSELVEVYADFDEELELTDDLKDLPWGIELEHWVAHIRSKREMQTP